MEKMLKEEKNAELIICLSHLGYSYSDNTVSDNAIASQSYPGEIKKTALIHLE